MSQKSIIVVALPSAARTTNGVSENFDVDKMLNLMVHVDVTALSGTPSMTLTYQTSPDNGTTWFDHPDITFTAMTTVSKQSKFLRNNTGRLARFSYTISGGTPNITFKVTVVGENPAAT